MTAALKHEFTFLDHFVKGVWGEHAHFQSDTNGGPSCAAQVPLSFVVGTIAVLVSSPRRLTNVCVCQKTPMYIITVRAGLTKLHEGFKKKEEQLRLANQLDPTRIEKLMGVICTLCMVANAVFKWRSMTLIFLLNPCHIICVSRNQVSLLTLARR